MGGDSLSATNVIPASADAVFAVLADPAKHSAIDGTGWVVESANGTLLSEVGQFFRMAMYHPNHPDGHYETVNRVEVFIPSKAIAWKPGYDADDGTIGFGGWTWRYDLATVDASSTRVTLTYDWSAVSGRLENGSGSRHSVLSI